MDQWNGTLPGIGNTDTDPLFVSSAGADGVEGTHDDDLRLQWNSPAADSGNPAYVSDGADRDLDGHVRILCGRIDMGAYELGVGDFDCNQTVNPFDFADWATCMNGPSGGSYPEGCEAFNFDYDGIIDLGDYARFLLVFDRS